MTTAEILEALRALPPWERRAVALALLRNEDIKAPGEESPIDSSRAWPVFTSPFVGDVRAEAFDHRSFRESRIDELVSRTLNEDHI
jgi:hypothetical protein